MSTRRLRSRTPLAAYLLTPLLLACGSKEEPVKTRPRGLTPSEAPTKRMDPPSTVEPEPTPPPPPRSSLPSPFAKSSDPGALMRTDAATPVEPPSAQAGSTEDAAAQRDLSSELAMLIGQPLQCLDVKAMAAGGGKLTISVRAQVVPSGRITRAEATAPGQADEALRCVERLVTASSLKGPVPGAPRSIAAAVTMQVVATP